MKITKELRGDIENVSVNLKCFSNTRLGKFFRDILEREIKKETKDGSNKKVKSKS